MELIGTQLGAPPGYGQTFSVSWNEDATIGFLHPLELRIAVREHTSLGVRPSTRQPLFALELLPTENHARTGTVPVDGGDLAVIPLRAQFRAALVARDGVERPTGRVGHDGIEDVGAAARNFELNRGSFVGAGWLDQCCTQGDRRVRRPAISVSVGVLASRYLPVHGVD